MKEMNNIHPGLYDDVKNEIRLTWAAITVIILLTIGLDINFIYLNNNYLYGTIFTVISIISIFIYLRYINNKLSNINKTLDDAKQLISTINPEQIMINSYDWNGWYVKIIHTDFPDTIHDEILRVKFPSQYIIIDNPVAAEMYTNENLSIIRLQDNRIIILANEPNECEKLINCPLFSPPRRIPLFIQFQFITGFGIGLLIMLIILFTLTDKSFLNNFNSVFSAIFVVSLMILYLMMILSYGLISLNNLKKAHFGWAIATDINPKIPEMVGPILIKKQIVTLHIRDKQGNEYSQIIKTNKTSSWPTFIEIPVLFYIESNVIPQHVSDIFYFCKIDDNGNITYNFSAVMITISLIIISTMMLFGLLNEKYYNF